VKPLFLTVLLAVAAMVQSQGQTDMVSLELGLAGAPVADAWNPLRVTTRDAGPGTLSITLELGSLLEGVTSSLITLPLEAGPGLRVVEVDVYLPPWRSLSWRYESGGRVLGSGALPRNPTVEQPLDLVVGGQAGVPSERLTGRWVEVQAHELPLRAAAYDGVRSIWFDRTTPLPSPTAMLAAASAGVLVVMDPDGLAATEWGNLLPIDGWQSLGPGAWTTIPPPSEAALELWRATRTEPLQRLLASVQAPLPPSLPRGTVLIGVALYLALLLITWRTGGVPGASTFAALLVSASLALPALLTPGEPRAERRDQLYLVAGGLAQRLEVVSVRSLPDAQLRTPGVWRRLDGIAEVTEFGSNPGISNRLRRWTSAVYLSPPSSAEPPAATATRVPFAEAPPW